jgi:hypothetical protein
LIGYGEVKKTTLGAIANIQIGLLLSRKQADEDSSPYRYRRLLPKALYADGTILRWPP